MLFEQQQTGVCLRVSVCARNAALTYLQWCTDIFLYINCLISRSYGLSRLIHECIVAKHSQFLSLSLSQPPSPILFFRFNAKQLTWVVWFLELRSYHRHSCLVVLFYGSQCRYVTPIKNNSSFQVQIDRHAWVSQREEIYGMFSQTFSTIMIRLYNWTAHLIP